MTDRAPYLTENADDSVTVQLRRPLTVAGVDMPSLTMREPTVADQLSVAKKATDAEREVALLANICEVAPADIGRLTMRDYGRLQEAYRDFLI
jgi:hypothetical protein